MAAGTSSAASTELPPASAGPSQNSQRGASSLPHHQAAAAAAEAAWAAATNYSYVWNAPQFAVPTSMQVFVPAVQYAGQQAPDYNSGSQVGGTLFILRANCL